jgi:hypothetical protein
MLAGTPLPLKLVHTSCKPCTCLANVPNTQVLRDLSPVRDVSDEAILTVIKNGSGVAGDVRATGDGRM